MASPSIHFERTGGYWVSERKSVGFSGETEIGPVEFLITSEALAYLVSPSLDAIGRAVRPPLTSSLPMQGGPDASGTTAAVTGLMGFRSRPHRCRTPPLPLLLRTFELTRCHALADRSIAAWLELPLILQRIGFTRSVLPCLVIGDKRLRLGGAPPELIAARLLDAAEASDKASIDCAPLSNIVHAASRPLCRNAVPGHSPGCWRLHNCGPCSAPRAPRTHWD